MSGVRGCLRSAFFIFFSDYFQDMFFKLRYAFSGKGADAKDLLFTDSSVDEKLGGFFRICAFLVDFRDDSDDGTVESESKIGRQLVLIVVRGDTDAQ